MIAVDTNVLVIERVCQRAQFSHQHPRLRSGAQDSPSRR